MLLLLNTNKIIVDNIVININKKDKDIYFDDLDFIRYINIIIK